MVHHINTEFGTQMTHTTLVYLRSCKINKLIVNYTDGYNTETSGKMLKSAKQSTSQYKEGLQKNLKPEINANIITVSIGVLNHWLKKFYL